MEKLKKAFGLMLKAAKWYLLLCLALGLVLAAYALLSSGDKKKAEAPAAPAAPVRCADDVSKEAAKVWVDARLRHLDRYQRVYDIMSGGNLISQIAAKREFPGSSTRSALMLDAFLKPTDCARQSLTDLQMGAEDMTVVLEAVDEWARLSALLQSTDNHIAYGADEKKAFKKIIYEFRLKEYQLGRVKSAPKAP